MSGFEYRSDDIKTSLPMPERFVRSNSNGETQIVWRWFSGWFVPGFLLFWLLIWFSFLWRFISALGNSGDHDVELTRWESLFEAIQTLDWWASIFPIPLVHILAGIAVAYALLMIMINKSTVTITSHEITIRHHPLPWYNRRPVALSSIDSFFPRQYTVKGRKGRRKQRYSVAADLHNNEFVDLIKLTSGQAQSETEFLAQELNTFLQGHKHL